MRTLYVIVALFIAVLLAGCAAGVSNEQEGGITGTGHSDMCKKKENRHKPECRAHRKENYPAKM